MCLNMAHVRFIGCRTTQDDSQNSCSSARVCRRDRRPPMCFNLDDADFLIDTMDLALSEL